MQRKLLKYGSLSRIKHIVSPIYTSRHRLVKCRTYCKVQDPMKAIEALRKQLKRYEGGRTYESQYSMGIGILKRIMKSPNR